VAATLLLLAGTVDAQRFLWWRDDSVQRRLGLAPEQSQRLEDVFQAAAPDLRAGKRRLDAAEKDLARIAEGEDDAALAAQVGRVEAARAELNTTRSLMLLRMRRVLSADQRTRLDALHKERLPKRDGANHRH